MDSEEFEKRMRALEYFHSLRVLPGAWIVVRVDGRSFSKFTAARFDKPFDLTFRGYMIETARALMEELHGLYAYTESDEISLLLRPDWDLFDREVEKIVSISASVASVAFSLTCGQRLHFDSRIWIGVDQAQVLDYFRWRMADAERSGLNSWCYWTLRNDGLDVAQATAALSGKSVADKNELLFQHGINYNNLPAWQRRGTGMYRERYEKTGYNPITKEEVVAIRRRITADQELPMKEAYVAFIQNILDSVRAEADERR